ncbi:MAG: hypothetical protein AAF568_11070, partial [Pseudomonadota bacterium]
VEIVSLGNIVIDNIILDTAYDVIDFNDLPFDGFGDIPTGPRSDVGTSFIAPGEVAEGFFFEGADVFPRFEGFDGPIIGPILGPPMGPPMEIIDIPDGPGLQPPFPMLPGEPNLALISDGPIFGEVIQPCSADPDEGDPVDGDLVMVMSRLDGADFDLFSLLIGAEAGFVDVFAFRDGEIVGSDFFNVTGAMNPGTLIEFGTDFDDIDEVHFVSDGDIVIDDVEVQNIGEPQFMLT